MHSFIVVPPILYCGYKAFSLEFQQLAAFPSTALDQVILCFMSKIPLY